MTLTIHGLAGSTCTGIVLATLYEKDVEDFVLQAVDIRSGAHKKPEFLKLQPFGVIPVLQDGDLTLFESRAICRYVVDKYASQGTPLYGTTLADKALVDQWMEVESQNYYPVVSKIVFHLVFAPMKGLPTNQEVLDENLEKLEKVLDIYEAHLAKNKYLAGDFFSLADVVHLSYTNYLINAAKKGQGITSRKHVNAWWESISSRPAWQKVLEMASKH